MEFSPRQRLAVVFIWLCCLSFALQAAPASRAETLVIATVSDSPKRHYQRLQPLVEHVASRLQGFGIRQGEVLLAPDVETLKALLRQGAVDWISESPFSAVQFQQAGADIVLKRDKKGTFDYASLIFVRADSPVHTLDDLIGRRIAFEDSGSTSAFFLPSLSLLQQGIPLQPLDTLQQTPAPDQLGYLFSGNEINTTLWVHKGVVSAGALSTSDWEDPQEVPSSLKPELRIIHRTRNYPRALELLRHDLPSELKTAITDILQAKDTSLPQRVLRAYSKTSRFLPLTAQDRQALQTIEAKLDGIRVIME